jgi:TctA family transporter
MMERTLRQALFITRGSVVEMLARPLTIAILVVPLAAFVVPPLLRAWRRHRDSAVEGAPGS